MALMKLWSGYGQTQRALDELLEEAKQAVTQLPENTATFTYYGVEVFYNAMSVPDNTKRQIMAALRRLSMPTVVPTPSPLSNAICAQIADDMQEDEDTRRARLLAEQKRVDAAMAAHLDKYEDLISRNDHTIPFMFADWVADAMVHLANPMMSYMMRQRFNYVMTAYSRYTQQLSSDDEYICNAKDRKPHVKARLEACHLVHDAVRSNSENRTTYGDHVFGPLLEYLRKEHFDSMHAQAA